MYDSLGTFEVSLSIITLDGSDDLGEATFTVVVDGEAPFIPTLGPGNPCTIPDTTATPIIFQTQNGDASCTCNFTNVGPAVAIMDTDSFPSGTVSTIWWGGAGTSQTGGTAPYTVQNGPFPTADSSLTIFEGQGPLGHYAQQGSYNLMHVVEFPGGCTYSAYYVMSWGAALIDFCANAAQSVCYPLEYPLCFGSQAPGTTYTIDWGDDSTQVFTYPNLPVSPNVVGHTYDPSCDSTGTAEGYVITVIATNACEVDTTINEQGPYYVSTPPEPEFTWDPSLVVCQEDSVIFTELITAGYQASEEHALMITFGNGPSKDRTIKGPGYQVTGEMGDIFYFWDPQAGDSQIQVDFTQPGVYAVTLTVQNDFCSPTSHTEYVTVNPIPYVEDDTILICTGDSIDYFPRCTPQYCPTRNHFQLEYLLHW